MSDGVVHCPFCTFIIDDTRLCARIWVQKTHASLETDLGYYVHEACCTTKYDSHIISPPVLHFSTSSLEPSPLSTPSVSEDLLSIFTIGNKNKTKVPSPPPILYPVQHHTDSSRPPILNSSQCLRDL